MAVINVYISGNNIQVSAGAVLHTSPNETVTLTLDSEYMYASPLTVTFGGSVWVSGGTQQLTPLKNASATIKNAWGNSGHILISKDGYLPASIIIDNTQPDINPDPFPFTPVANMVPSASVISNRVKITGINREAQVTVVGGRARVGDNAWGDGYSNRISNNQTLEIMAESPANFGQQKSVSVTVGERTEVWLISTKATPSNLIKTSSVRSGFSLRNNVRDFFAGGAITGATIAPKNISAFVRGGDYIPDIPNNIAIPTAKNGMMLSQFIGAATYLDWIQGGRSQVRFIRSGATTGDIYWSLTGAPHAGTVLLDHPRVGYKKILGACEIKWEIHRSDGGATSAVTVPSALLSYDSANAECKLSAFLSDSPYLGVSYYGFVRVYVRHKVYTNIVLTRDLPFSFIFEPIA